MGSVLKAVMRGPCGAMVAPLCTSVLGSAVLCECVGYHPEPSWQTGILRGGLGSPAGCGVPPHLSTSSLWLGLVTAAMYCMMCLLASVFPAPLSPGGEKSRFAPPQVAGHPWHQMRRPGVPEMTMQVSLALCFMARYAALATA